MIICHSLYVVDRCSETVVDRGRETQHQVGTNLICLSLRGEPI